VGILALDVSRFGIVMSADSQPVELLDGRNRVARTRLLSRNPILVRRGGGFAGLVAFVGRERIAGKPTREWLHAFSAQHPDESLMAFCTALADELSRRWRRQRLRSGLWVFVSGFEGSEVRFWYVSNVEGVNPSDGTYKKPGPTFTAVDDLDKNYLAPELNQGRTKAQSLRLRMYQFRNGVIRPTALIFDIFNEIMQRIYEQRIPGFTPIRSITDLAYYDRQRMEFAKRLHSPKHGMASKASSPGIAGEVHVMAVAPRGVIRHYPKIRGQERLVP
jgi:hypothetical protein